MHEHQFQFEWDDVKAVANARKHEVSFDLARTIFNDPLLLTIADLEHSETEERWFSIGRAVNGSMLSVIYLWSVAEISTTKIRISPLADRPKQKSVNMKRAYKRHANGRR